MAIDETGVTGTRGSGIVGLGRMGLGKARGQSYGDSSYSFSIKGSPMMEDDLAGDRSMSKEEREEEYDKMYNYTDTERKKLLKDEVKTNLKTSIDEAVTDRSLIKKPSLFDKAKGIASEYLVEEVDKTADLGKTYLDVTSPLNVGTTILTSGIQTTTNLLNFFGKNLGLSKGKLNADKVIDIIDAPNNLVKGITHGLIDRGADAVTGIIKGEDQGEDQGGDRG